MQSFAHSVATSIPSPDINSFTVGPFTIYFYALCIIAGIIVATFILLSLVFGSVILPAKAVIMNLLGTGATLGILTWMFVDGVGADLFNFSPGPLMSPVLVLIVAIVYGLSTDYEVFLVSRMVEARAHGACSCSNF